MTAEVIDLRTLRPLDEQTVARVGAAGPIGSWSSTRRWRSGSLSAEIAARIVEQAFYDLDAPVERVCAAEVPVPYATPPRGGGTAQARDDVTAAVRRAVG